MSIVETVQWCHNPVCKFGVHLQSQEASLALREEELNQLRDLKTQQEMELRARVEELTQELARLGHELPRQQHHRASMSEDRELFAVFEDSSALKSENLRLKSDLDYSVRENRR